MRALGLVGRLLTIAVALAVAPRVAHAQPPPEPPRVNWALDSGITIASLVGTGLAGLIAVPAQERWDRQLLPFDDGLLGHVSGSAAQLSDILAAVEVTTPLALFLAGGLQDDTGRRSLIYGETLGLSLLANNVVKYAVRRPRPYVYSDDPRIQTYARAEGADSHLSFYSGHASTTFAAAIAGSYLFAQRSNDVSARAFVWGFTLTTAAATATLRTRAGKHFYSDVLVGAVIGAAFGVGVPYLHGGTRPQLSRPEIVAISVGPLAGIAIAALPHWPRTLPHDLDAPPASASASLTWLPWLGANRAGLLAATTF
jgi:membrane-associated phospholipid phosphatase